MSTLKKDINREVEWRIQPSIRNQKRIGLRLGGCCYMLRDLWWSLLIWKSIGMRRLNTCTRCILQTYSILSSIRRAKIESRSAGVVAVVTKQRQPPRQRSLFHAWPFSRLCMLYWLSRLPWWPFLDDCNDIYVPEVKGSIEEEGLASPRAWSGKVGRRDWQEKYGWETVGGT